MKLELVPKEEDTAHIWYKQYMPKERRQSDRFTEREWVDNIFSDKWEYDEQELAF